MSSIRHLLRHKKQYSMFFAIAAMLICPVAKAQAKLYEQPEEIPPQRFPHAREKENTGACFYQLRPEMSVAEVVDKCGRPDEEAGSGAHTFVWRFNDMSHLAVSASSPEKILGGIYILPDGRKMDLVTHNTLR